MMKRTTPIPTKSEIPAALILTAAGSSTRMGSATSGVPAHKKEYIPLNGGTVLSSAARIFLETIHFPLVVVTYPFHENKIDDDTALAQCKAAFFADKELIRYTQNSENNSHELTAVIFVRGGSTRQSSVLNALEAVQAWFTSHEKGTACTGSSDPLVFIHDAARPFVTAKIINDTALAASTYGAAVPALQPVDTQKEVDSNGMIVRHLVRSQLAAVQTPQVFRLTPLLTAHRKAAAEKKEYTDDTEIWDTYAADKTNTRVHVVPGDSANKKITYPEDIQHEQEKKMIHTGLGYDLHRLTEGRKLVLGGVVIPFNKGEDGHSDGDVLLHAVTDALLGASGLGDIGSFFPPSDPQWKDADSCMLLKTVWNKITAAGWKLINMDCVIALEQPKFLPYRDQVCSRIAEVLGCDKSQIFVKAKTGEKLGDIGEGRAVEAWVTCLLEK